MELLALVFGASASGKSEYAENLLTEISGGCPRVYLATMDNRGAESARRIERHRLLRAGKGFETREYPAGRWDPASFEGCAVLLEDLDNLLANRMFSPQGIQADAARALDNELKRLERAAAHLVVVSGDVGRDGTDCPEQTAAWQRGLARLQRALSARYDRVTEVVCSLPLVWKGAAG